MKKSTLFIVILALSSLLNAQIFRGQIKGLKKQAIEIYAYNGMANYLIGQTVSDEKGTFTFKADSSITHGILTLQATLDIQLDFIYSGTTIKFSTSKIRPFSDMKFQNSAKNEDYYAFNKLRGQYKMLIQYIQTNAATQKLADSVVYKLVETADNNFVASVSKLAKETKFQKVKDIINCLSYPTPLLEAYDNKLYPTFKNRVFLQMLSEPKILNSTFLLHTPFLNYRLNILYYNLLAKSKQKKIIDISQKLLKSTIFPNKYLIINYLQNYFGMTDKSEALSWLNQYIKQNKIKYSHSNELASSAKNISKLQIGKTIPDQAFFGVDKTPVYIKDTPADKTLLIFWRTTCSHCTHLLTQLTEVYPNIKATNTGIFAVSIDESKTDWTNFLLENKIKWLNFIDTNAFNDSLIDKYNILYTPKIFLLDKNKKIIAKPDDFDAIMENLEIKNNSNK